MRWVALAVACVVGGVGCDGGPCPSGTSQFQRVIGTQTEIWCARPDGTAHGPYESESAGAGVVEGAFRDGLADGHWRYRGENAGLERDEGFDLGRPHGEWTASYGGQASGGLLYRHFFAYGVPCGVWEEQGAGGLEVAHDYGSCEQEAPPVTPAAGKPAPAVAPEWAAGLSCPAGTKLREPEALQPQVAACVDSKDGATLHGPWQRRVGARVVTEGRYERGTKTGVWRTWFELDSGGASFAAASAGLASETRYVGGLEDGEVLSWRADGSALGLQTWDLGLRSGAQATWYPSGAPEMSGTYEAGLRTGVWTRQFETGVVETSETWAAGERSGAASQHFASGAVADEGQYAAGLKTGVWKSWYSWGAARTEGAWAGGIEQGPFKSFTAAGTPDTTGQYVDGLASGEWTFWSDIDGVRVRERGQFVFGGQEGLWVATLPDGTKLSETHYAGGLREGAYLAWFEGGDPAIEGAYLDDLSHGRWRLWDESGALLLDCQYARGAKHGLCLRWWPSGQERSRITFTYGSWAGDVAQCWDEQGTARECVLGDEI